MRSPVRVVLSATDPDRGSQLAGWLATAGYSIVRNENSDFVDEVLRRERPDVFIIASSGPREATATARAGRLARGLMIPSIIAVDAGPELIQRVQGFDDWVLVDRAEADLPLRVEWLLGRPPSDPIPVADPRFLALVVHDLRTPLNVIGLTIRAISQSNSTGDPEFEEDLNFLQENARQIERMLAQLGDFSRLIESERSSTPVDFQARRFLADFLEEKQAKRDSEYKAVRLEFGADSPDEVTLDATKARLALSHALANAVAAAGDTPVKIRSSGSAASWTIEFIVDKAPPTTTAPTRLRGNVFERLLGSAAERRGLDLAIVSRVSESFGGSARLDVEAGTRSVVVIEWPTRPDPPAQPG